MGQAEAGERMCARVCLSDTGIGNLGRQLGAYMHSDSSRSVIQACTRCLLLCEHTRLSNKMKGFNTVGSQYFFYTMSGHS